LDERNSYASIISPSSTKNSLFCFYFG